MKAAEDGRRYDAAHVLDGAMNRGVLVERPMSPQPYNRWRTSSESGVSALRPKQPDGWRTRVGSIRSVFRQSRSAKANLARWACHGCPSLLIGASPQRRRPDLDPGSGSAEPHSKEMPP